MTPPPPTRPDTVTTRPDAVTTRPDAVTTSPDAVTTSPDAVMTRPDTVAARPNAVVVNCTGDSAVNDKSRVEADLTAFLYFLALVESAASNKRDSRLSHARTRVYITMHHKAQTHHHTGRGQPAAL